MFEKKKAKCDMGEGRSKNLIFPVSTFRMPPPPAPGPPPHVNKLLGRY